MQTDRPGLVRVVRLLAIAIAMEVSLAVIANRAPALAGLIRPAYFVVGGAFVVGAWYAARTRSPGGDRRSTDRRRPWERE